MSSKSITSTPRNTASSLYLERSLGFYAQNHKTKGSAGSGVWKRLWSNPNLSCIIFLLNYSSF